MKVTPFFYMLMVDADWINFPAENDLSNVDKTKI